MNTPALTLVWSDTPNPVNGAVTVCARAAGTSVYGYYQSTPDGRWQLVAVALDDRQATEWRRHRIEPEPVAEHVAHWLDGKVR